MNENRIILNITPQTNIRATQGAAILFRIPENCPINCGLPRKSQKQPKVLVETMQEAFPDLWRVLGGENWKNRRKKKEIRYGCPHCLTYENLGHKRRLEKYNKYKEEMKRLAAENNFTIPKSGCALYFYVPVSKSWSNKKKKAHHGQMKLTQPDIDNYEKAFFDSLKPKDESIGQLSGHGKFWVNQEQGYIEILLNQHVYNPFEVKLII